MKKRLQSRPGDSPGGHGGNIGAVADRFGLKKEDICDFSSNINPLGVPEGLPGELKDHLHEICSYPEPLAATLRRGLAGHLAIPEEKILLGNGANELIHLFFLWSRPGKVLIPAPTFSEYERAARLSGATVERFLLPPGVSLQAGELMKRLQGVDLVVLCNPNNPTGAYYRRELVEEVVLGARQRGAAVLLDESFFTLTGKPPSESMAPSGHDNLWTVVSLTKLWALPGLRLGYIVGPRGGIKKLSAGDPWRVNALAQRAGLYCLKDEGYVRKSIELVREERQFLMGGLQEIDGLKVFPGEANFLLLRGEKEGFNSRQLYGRLASQGVLIRDASNFPGLDHRYFRVAVLRRPQNELLLEKIASCL